MFRFEFRRYSLPFRSPVRTAHGWWREREGVLVQLEDENGWRGWGEAAPIPWFGTETVDEIEAACRELGAFGGDERFAAVPERLGCLRNALAAAREGADGARQRGDGHTASVARSESGGGLAAGAPRVREVQNGGRRAEDRIFNAEDAERAEAGGRLNALGPEGAGYLGVAALVPAGRAALAEIMAKGEAGYRVFKWKVGVGDVADELALFDDVCAALPDGGKLRLDANGAWDRRQAERWLERCANRPVEFVEQPCFAGATAGGAERQRSDDLLRGLAQDFPTPIALDESLVSEGDVERWLGAGWRGVFVVKPALFGDVDRALARLAEAKAAVVFSSALETAVGARAALLRALDWPGERRALGFGVWPLFADARCDGPVAAPFLRREEVERIDPEAVWNALR